ncbi:organic cation transporter protein-like [Tubulanus polymorphus]|uniref:organic cation transporter protein-like n=1 Tax=Tubulanus polymorphus TaxID=672921 RepID=UPI003DA5B60E
MFGKWAITSAFNSVILFTTEVFPTNARNTAFGICLFAARVGAMLSPFSIFLAGIHRWLPIVIFAAMSIVSAFVVLLLPETLNRPLPETIEQIKAWDKQQKYWSFELPKLPNQTALST